MDSWVAVQIAGQWSGDWEADRALEAVAYLYLATGHSGGFVEAAKALGSRSRMPVVAMAEHAIGSGDRETARAVFDAADQPGPDSSSDHSVDDVPQATQQRPLARVANALDRHLVLSFPSEVPDTLTDAVHVS